MSAQMYRLLTALVAYVGAVTAAALAVAGLASWLCGGSQWVFGGVFTALAAASLWPGVRLLEAVDRAGGRR